MFTTKLHLLSTGFTALIVLVCISYAVLLHYAAIFAHNVLHIARLLCVTLVLIYVAPWFERNAVSFLTVYRTQLSMVKSDIKNRLDLTPGGFLH